MNTSDLIKYHSELGVYREYRGYKYQPQRLLTLFIRPGSTELLAFLGDERDFKKRVDRKLKLDIRRARR